MELIGAFRRRLAGLRCPNCGSGDIRFPVRFTTGPAVLMFFWPVVESAKNGYPTCQTCGQMLLSTMGPSAAIVLGLSAILSMVAYMLYPGVPPQPWTTFVIWAFGYLFADPLTARVALKLGKA
ncbi:hypothetical protein [Gymnodinialimonas hymeniacidonis]|uniref:hypothetical protein n=1 Tax=Gymnodinialimonas hymeniacidonis TaxID=3126508 RepID=UPI0034C5D828